MGICCKVVANVWLGVSFDLFAGFGTDEALGIDFNKAGTGEGVGPDFLSKFKWEKGILVECCVAMAMSVGGTGGHTHVRCFAVGCGGV